MGFSTVSLPVTVGGLSNVTALTSGAAHSCALRVDQTVACWGENSVGQLGNGTTANSAMPLPVSGLSGVTALAAGASSAHTCALLLDQTVRCWGYNSVGQLGDGTTVNATTPITVSGLAGVTALAAGGDHTCAILTDQTVKCWGSNRNGQLGDGAITNATTPVAASGLANVVSLAAGMDATCAVLTDHTVQCWGSGRFGNAYNPSVTTDYTLPTAIEGLTNVSALAMGGREHTCALLADQTVSCWGMNNFGQLGNGTGTQANSATPVAVTGLGNVMALVTGVSHTCAVLVDQSMKCWGMNNMGQLGTGVPYYSPTPVQVVGL